MEAGPNNDDDDLPPFLVDLNDSTTLPTEQQATDREERVESNVLGPCPITILSGFLGSGKTTLVQYILNAQHGKRIAVIENEFGGGVDSLSIESLIARDGIGNGKLQDLVELPNGCVCCTVKDSLVVTIENLLNRKRTLIDYILVESSGMANPGPIASIFWLDDALQSRIRLDGIVTLVDALHIETQLNESVEAAQQIAYADRIIVNKTDLLPKAGAIDHVEVTIRHIHPTAILQRASYAAIPDLDWILDIGCYDQSQQEPDFVSDLDCCHTAFVSTITLYRSDPLSMSAINRWLADILWPDQDVHVAERYAKNDLNNETGGRHWEKTQSSEIYRIKGVALILDEDFAEPSPHIIQAVHDLWEIRPLKSVVSMQGCKLILIGRQLDEAALRNTFAALQ